MAFFLFFLQNSFELSYKYDTVCHLSPFYCEMFTKFVDFFLLVSFFMFIAFTYQNLVFSTAAADEYSTIYFNYFHIAHTYIFSALRAAAAAIRKSHTTSIYLLSYTHQQFSHFLEQTKLCKTIAKEKKNANNNHCRDKRTKLKQTFCNVAFTLSI